MIDFQTALKEELKELDIALSADPRYRRMRMVRELLNEYESLVSLPVRGTVGQPKTLDPETQSRPATKAAKIKSEITALMSQAGGSVTRRQMLEHLESKGLLGKEAKPLKRLAIYLTQAKTEGIIGNDGSGNWFLKPK